MDNRGFSLIELLVVILVLAVLTGIGIPAYYFITARARESGTETEMMNIANAIEIHNSDNGAYPLTAEYPDALEDSGYIDTVPLSDAWNNAYAYESDGTSYTLTSRGVDGISGNADDIIVSNGAMTGEGAYDN